MKSYGIQNNMILFSKDDNLGTANSMNRMILSHFYICCIKAEYYTIKHKIFKISIFNN